jgi:hypothetical protein
MRVVPNGKGELNTAPGHVARLRTTCLHTGKPDSGSSERLEKRDGSLCEFRNQVQTTFWQFLPQFGPGRIRRLTASLIADLTSRRERSHCVCHATNSTQPLAVSPLTTERGSLILRPSAPATRQFGDNVHRDGRVPPSRSMAPVIVVPGFSRLQLVATDPIGHAATMACGRRHHRDRIASGQTQQVRR